MDILILSIFAIVVALSFIEEYMPAWQKVFILITIGIAMILISTFKPMTTADADNYEFNFYNNDNIIIEMTTEPTFLYLSRLYLSLGYGITAMFFTYALISIPLKLTLLWKLTPYVFTSLIVYAGIYYPMHDVVQIRCGAAIAFLLWAMIPLVKRQYFKAGILLAVATLFHYSSLAFLPIFFFGNMKINKYWKWLLGVSVPICLLLYFAGFSFINLIPQSLIGGKVDYYKDMSETGVSDSLVPYTQLRFMAEFALLYVFIFFYDTIEKHCTYAPILIKVLALGMAFHIMFADIEALGNRLHDLFGMFNVLAYTQCLYCFKPHYAVRIGITLISLLHYIEQMLSNMYFH